MKKVINKQILFLPVECTPRELDYKIHIARLFCQQGFDVMIGHPPFIRDELKYKNYKGVLIENGASPLPDYYKMLKEKGIALYCLGDEGAAKPAYSVTYPPAVEALKTMEYIFLWGYEQKYDLIARNDDPELISKYYVLGYPGFEFSFHKYKEYHKKLKPKSIPSDYILVNTNFGACNGFSIEENIQACPHMSPQTRANLEKLYTTEKLVFKNFYGWLVDIINNFPEEIFLIRSHPAENQLIYKKYFGLFKNVIISTDGNANQVICNAKLVIHSTCTTALQSYLMGVPVISLSFPSLEHIKDTLWTLSFGASPTSVIETQELIKYVLKTKGFSDNLTAHIKEKASIVISKMFCNLENSSKDLISIICSNKKFINDEKISYKLIDTRSILLKCKLFIRKLLPMHYKWHISARGLLLPFSKKDIQNRIKYINDIDGIYLEYKVKKIYHNTFFITVI